ncbi:MAG: D-alanine--D-alanine ligase [Bacteroidota bacterium]|nr:D-alanine--D-alanine ligase [Bacteroidota bacterium]MDP4229918.1 D-alanine--D-alanine ligase [Bacteroidota bacterium]MDP4235588.1 D-alanine--D-alanine ligase [Bacteroidota bacterium]
MDLCVLFGGTSAEREISLLSGYAMARAYETLGHNVTLLDPATGRIMGIKEYTIAPPHATAPTPEELGALSQGSVFVDSLTSQAVRKADVVVIGLHGVPGEDGTVQAVLELLGKKFTGSGSRSSAISIDKAYTKILLEAAGVPTPKWSFISSSSPEMLESIMKQSKEKMPGGIVVKPNDQGSTVGLTISTQADFDFEAGIRLAWKYSKGALIEEFIEGRELTVTVLDGEPLPIVEIAPEGGFYDYHHKYTKGMTQYFAPADLPSELAKKIQQSALTVYSCCDCRGYARVDYRLKPDGSFYCLEINTLPGMTETSLVPKAAKAAGMSFEELCAKILKTALD